MYLCKASTMCSINGMHLLGGEQGKRERNKETNEVEGKERKKARRYGNMEEGNKAKKTA